MKRTVLITGASSGIGYELAQIFSQQNYRLVLVARSLEKLKDLVKTLGADDALVLAKDISQSSAPLEIFNELALQKIDIDVLVNNAGFGDFGFFHQTDWIKQNQMIQLNITTLTHLTHLFLPQMIRKKSGYILNVASTAAFQPGPTMSVYYATKAYVLHFSEAIANEVEGTGVSVTALCPGATQSGFQEAAQMQDSRLVKGRKLPTSQEVAQFGYESLMAKKKVAIHGAVNYLMANSIRFTPRALVLKIVRSLQDKVTSHY